MLTGEEAPPVGRVKGRGRACKAGESTLKAAPPVQSQAPWSTPVATGLSAPCTETSPRIPLLLSPGHALRWVRGRDAGGTG